MQRRFTGSTGYILYCLEYSRVRADERIEVNIATSRPDTIFCTPVDLGIDKQCGCATHVDIILINIAVGQINQTTTAMQITSCPRGRPTMSNLSLRSWAMIEFSTRTMQGLRTYCTVQVSRSRTRNCLAVLQPGDFIPSVYIVVHVRMQ